MSDQQLGNPQPEETPDQVRLTTGSADAGGGERRRHAVATYLRSPGRIIPGPGKWLLKQKATWTFVVGGLVGAMIALSLTGALPISTTSPERDITLHVYGGDDSSQHARERAIATWNRASKQRNDRVQAVYHGVGGTADEQRQHLTTVLDPESITQVDLVVVDFPDLPRFARQDRLLPLEREDPSGFLGAPLEACRDRKHLWGLPLNADAPLLAYNVDLLSRALQLDPRQLQDRYSGQDQSIYDRIRQDGIKALKTLRPSHPELTAVYAGQFDDYEGFTVNAVEHLATEGVDLDADRYLEREESRDAVLEFTRWLAQPQVLPEGSLAGRGGTGHGYTEQDSQTALREGTVLFARLWPVHVKALTDLKHQENATAPTIGSVQLTGGVLGGQALAIAAKTPHVRAAERLQEFLTDDMSQLQLFVEGGYLPTRDVVYEVPAVRDDPPVPVPAIDGALRRPRMVYYAEYSQQLRTEIRYALIHGGLASDASVRLEAASEGRFP